MTPYSIISHRQGPRRLAVAGGILLLIPIASPARAQVAANPVPPALAIPTEPSAFAQSAPSDQTASNADSGSLAFFRRTEISGFADIYYAYNFNTPATRQSQLRNFDIQHNSFSLNLAELALEKKPTADSRGGFRIDLDYGSATAIIHASEPGGLSVFQNIGQAYVSYLAPAGRGLQFDVGEFLTPIGNESIKTKDNWNYSRSLLFTLAEPYYHMGVRATYGFGDRLTLAGYLVNGWNDVVDNNTGKSVGVQVAFKPASSVSITETYMAGPEQPNDNTDWRQLSDTVVSLTATPHVSLAGSYDYGRDAAAGAPVSWQGVAAYLRFQPRAWFAVSPRLEYYDDKNGFTTGVAQKLKELTLTAELKDKDGVILRIEYREDFSCVPFFLRAAAAPVHRQPTVTVGLLYAFSSRSQ